jgi:hypothetical protein
MRFLRFVARYRRVDKRKGYVEIGQELNIFNLGEKEGEYQ